MTPPESAGLTRPESDVLLVGRSGLHGAEEPTPSCRMTRPPAVMA